MLAPTETCPERDKFGRTRPCDGRSYTNTSFHTEFFLPVSMSIWITQRDATRVASNFLQTLPATTDDEPACRTMTQACAKT